MFPSLRLLADIASTPFKRAQHGLFHGKTKQFGNNVPFSKHKTRRTWLPNVQKKTFFSDTLGRQLRMNVSMKALRTIRKHGGLDKYLLSTKPELLGWEGMRLRVIVRGRAKSNDAKLPKPRKESEASSGASA